MYIFLYVLGAKVKELYGPLVSVYTLCREEGVLTAGQRQQWRCCHTRKSYVSQSERVTSPGASSL